MTRQPDLGGYVDVATRVAEFREAHPEGSLQPANLDRPWELVEVDGARFLVYGAAAYRTPDDPRPGIGYAWEAVPGRTPYTRGSELQNAETSAWGRALVAVLAADSRQGIASRDEVEARQADRDADRRPPARTDHEWLTGWRERLADHQTEATLRGLWAELRAAASAGNVTDEDGAAARAEWSKRADLVRAAAGVQIDTSRERT